MDLLDSCFAKASDLSDSERASVYYISGYVAFKEQIPVTSDSITSKPAECEFIDLVSRGKLKYPPPELYDLGLYMFAFFKNRNQKCCSKVFLQSFKEIYELSGHQFTDIDSIIKRFSNCFFKGLVGVGGTGSILGHTFKRPPPPFFMCIYLL